MFFLKINDNIDLDLKKCWYPHVGFKASSPKTNPVQDAKYGHTLLSGTYLFRPIRERPPTPPPRAVYSRVGSGMCLFWERSPVASSVSLVRWFLLPILSPVSPRMLDNVKE